MNRRTARSLLLVCSLTAALLVPVIGQASPACASTPGNLYLARFFDGRGGITSNFYVAGEDGGSATATIWEIPGDCRSLIVEGDYGTANGSAEAGSDYEATAGWTDYMCDDVHREAFCPADMPFEHRVDIPIVNDTQSEAAVESFLFRLTRGSMGLADPSSAPVHIVDDDGLQRFSLEPTVDGTDAVAYSRSESFSSIRIPVFRAGPAADAASIAYQVAPSGANPATPDEDYIVPATGSIGFAAGERAKTLDIQIVNDTEIEPDETFDVTLTGADAVHPTTTTVTIIDNDSDNIPPKSWFHHPRHGKVYPSGDYRLREMHVFVSDEGGSEVVRVQMALRKKRLSGSCAWWAKGRWVAGSCSTKRWLAMEFDFDLYLRRFPRLSPSVGTRIKNYTAWSRATDGAGNVQTAFVKSFKRGSWNTFEVKKA